MADYTAADSEHVFTTAENGSKKFDLTDIKTHYNFSTAINHHLMLRHISIFVLILLWIKSNGQPKGDPKIFSRGDYPKEIYNISSDTFKLRNLRITVTQIRPYKVINYDSVYSPCRAWLTVTKNGINVFQRFFRNILPYAICHGIFVPLQPRDDYFIISKLGDSDGKIFIIDSLGNVTERIGGEFVVSPDKRFLLSNYVSSKSYGLTVFDFQAGQYLFSEKIKLPLTDWYFQDSKFISYLREDDDHGDNVNFARFDFGLKNLVVFNAHYNYLKTENKLPAFQPWNYTKKCSCGISE